MTNQTASPERTTLANQTASTSPLDAVVSQRWEQDGVTIVTGDCREVLPLLPAESINCCVTSPPYWGLRDYGNERQIGTERTAQEFVDGLVAVFAAVRRVLRDDGTLWLNLGDTYNAFNAAAGPGGWPGQERRANARPKLESGFGLRDKGLKEKDLIGVPWRVALALQADGWFLRSDIIWHKTNPMPESVKDRPTKSHEYLFLLAKTETYYYDYEAVLEDGEGNGSGNKAKRWGNNHTTERSEGTGAVERHSSIPWEGRPTRNRRTVWTVPTKPYNGAHFATFPPELIEPCIMAGCPEGGTVLDPFLGSGTTAEVAQRNGCRCVGIELNADYVEIAKARFRQRSLLAASG